MENKCPICYEDLIEKIKASPNVCDHVFCLPCLERWSKQGNFCPIDRKRYRKILNLDSDDVIQVKPRKRKRKRRALYEFSYLCEVCEVDQGSLLICDCCNLCFHLYCLNPPLKKIPDGQWFCPTCSKVEKKLKREKGITKEVEAAINFKKEVSKKAEDVLSPGKFSLEASPKEKYLSKREYGTSSNCQRAVVLQKRHGGASSSQISGEEYDYFPESPDLSSCKKNLETPVPKSTYTHFTEFGESSNMKHCYDHVMNSSNDLRSVCNTDFILKEDCDSEISNVCAGSNTYDVTSVKKENFIHGSAIVETNETHKSVLDNNIIAEYSNNFKNENYDNYKTVSFNYNDLKHLTIHKDGTFVLGKSTSRNSEFTKKNSNDFETVSFSYSDVNVCNDSTSFLAKPKSENNKSSKIHLQNSESIKYCENKTFNRSDLKYLTICSDGTFLLNKPEDAENV